MTQASNDVFALAETRLSWIERRQGVLAQNIANANTPGYISHDMKPFSEMLEAAAKRAPGAAPVDRGVPETSIDGNGVSLDQQMEKVAETDTAHQLAMNLYKKYIGLFRSAIGRA